MLGDVPEAAGGKWRADCWCAQYRKPCQYHDGYEDGFDAATARAETAITLLREADEDVRVAFMHLEEVILSLPGRWNDPLVPDECSEALRVGYASLNAIRAFLAEQDEKENPA